MGRIVLFGATGYTGRLTADALVARGAKPLLAARSPGKLRELAADLDLEYQAADVERPETVADLVQRGDVLVSTVGPFTRWGEPAVQAAIASGAHYLDSTGESPFIRSVFERYGGAAEAAGCGLVTAFGYDWVPGNLAGALALRDAGKDAVRVDVGYFITGGGAGGMSGGTRASSVEALLEPSYGFHGGRLVTERGAKRVRHFDVKGRSRPGVSVGTSEAFALPRLQPDLREANVYLGWFGDASRPLSVMGVGIDLWRRVPVLGTLPRTVLRRVVKGSSGGPDAAARAQSGSYVIGAAYNAAGAQIAEAVLTGVNGYDFTARVLAWGAERALADGLQGTGALGPVDAFGLDALESGAAEAGITRT